MRLTDKEFEQWYSGDRTEQGSPFPALSDFYKERDGKNDEEIMREFMESVNAMRAPFTLNLNEMRRGFTFTSPFIFDHSIQHDEARRAIIPLVRLSISGEYVVTVKNAVIGDLRISNHAQKIVLENCCIRNLSISNPQSRNAELFLDMRNCQIGKLEVSDQSTKSLEATGCAIYAVDCKTPGKGNPFSGSVNFFDTRFVIPTYESKLYPGPQQFRNLRSHLEELENELEAGKMRSLELKAERRHEVSGINKFFSWYQDKSSDYGQAPARPLCWALCLYLIMVGLVLIFDLAAPEARAPGDFFEKGWKSILLEDSVWGKLSRSFILPGQYIVSPLGILGTQTLLVSKSGWWNIGLSGVGLLCDFLIATSFLAIRKRFKLH